MTDTTAPVTIAPHLGQPLYGASFGQAFARFWRKYTVFTGRASRSEFWWAYLAVALIWLVAALLVSAAVGITVTLAGASDSDGASGALVAVIVLCAVILLVGWIAIVIPTVAVLARRFHDADLSALLLLLWLIPYVGFIPVLIIATLPSNPRGSRFDQGANPSALAPAPYPYEQHPPAQHPPAPASSAQHPPTRHPDQRPRLGQPDLSVPPAPAAATEAPVVTEPSPFPVPDRESSARESSVPESSARQPTAIEARHEAWARVGEVQPDASRALLPSSSSSSSSAGPAWPGGRRSFVRVALTDGLDVIASDGLTDGDAAGLGAEVYLALRRSPESDGWREAVLVQTAQNLAHGEVLLAEALGANGALSMSLPGITAPADWRSIDGAVGVLIGIPLPGVGDQVALPSGRAHLIGIVPLRPDELARILADGPAARRQIARALSSLPPAALTDPDRPSVA